MGAAVPVELAATVLPVAAFVWLDAMSVVAVPDEIRRASRRGFMGLP
jgi:hypothetical protein